VLIDDLEQTLADAPDGSAVQLLAGRHLKLLRQRGAHGVTAAMRREARKAVADAERIDRDLEATARLLVPLLPQIEAILRRRRREDEARHAADIRARLLGELDPPFDGGANP
ncbi:MAG: hypothetical protein LBK59_03655, partial [Bifidobacteriaceae bacterium]|nr:hypothetical protein [Bifidobacteriaceae bacterium]